MPRSSYKVRYVHRSFFLDSINSRKKKINKGLIKLTKNMLIVNLKRIPKFLFFWNRNSFINKWIMDKKICLYNGKFFTSINIFNKGLLEFKIRDLLFTKKIHIFGKKRKLKARGRIQKKVDRLNKKF
jgi:ribosomal protein S19